MTDPAKKVHQHRKQRREREDFKRRHHCTPAEAWRDPELRKTLEGPDRVRAKADAQQQRRAERLNERLPVWKPLPFKVFAAKYGVRL